MGKLKCYELVLSLIYIYIYIYGDLPVRDVLKRFSHSRGNIYRVGSRFYSLRVNYSVSKREGSFFIQIY